MIALDYVYGCDGCLKAEVVEVESGLGHKPPDPLSHLPQTWTTEEGGLIFCPECSNRGNRPLERGAPAVDATKLEEVSTVFNRILMALFIVFCIGIGPMGRVCFASGNMEVTFDQPADCDQTAGWELSWEPTNTAGSKPGAGAFGASIPNDGSKFTCGLGAKTIQSIVGVGNNRFWIRAVGVPAATFSEYSNFVDANVPFAAPVLRSVDAAF